MRNPAAVRPLLLFLLLMACCPVALPAQAAAPVIDLSHTAADVDLTTRMAVRDGATSREIPAPRKALAAPGWVRGDAAQALLPAPRERSTLWLTAIVNNTGDAPLSRWIRLSPWRLTRVDAWAMAPASGEVLAHAQSGMEIPLGQRTVQEKRALIPVTLLPGERQRLLIRVHSTSRPFLTLHSHDPVAFTAQEAGHFHRYSLMLTGIMTLLAVLLLQGDRRYALIGIWMLSTFVLESEKEGYVSYVLIPALADYANQLRFTAWILTSALFLTVSVWLLNQQHKAYWRLAVYLALGVSGGFSLLSFVLDAERIREVGSVIDMTLAGSWLLLVPGALRQRRPWQRTILALLGVWWAVYAFILLGYVFNFYYTAAFASSKFVAEIVTVIGLLLVYALQKRTRERDLEQRLRHRERQQRKTLEHTVAKRTRLLRHAADDAREANAAKSDFLARVTHDLRSPLTSILGYAQLLSAESGPTGQMSRTIHGSATHMLNLVDRLIGYARGVAEKPVRPHDFYLPAFLDDIGREAEIAASANGSVFTLTKTSALPPMIHEDATCLRQILLNLLDNAAKHTHRGRIGLTVAYCAPAAGRADGQLAYHVEDTGCGMPDSVQQRLWEPFFQSANHLAENARQSHYQGMGLGLAIVHQLTGQLGGRLDVASQPGRGTRISLTLPFTPGQESAPQTAVYSLPHHVLPDLDATGLTVWVVEDAPAIRELLATELGALGFATRLFDSAEAFTGAQATPAPDLVLTDYFLPRANGDAVLSSAQSRFPRTPVVVLSATQPDSQGATGYAARLTKPVDLATLRRTLADVCQRELQQPAALHASAADGGDSTETPPIPLPLSFEERHQLASLIELGAVTDLMEWSQALAANTPERADTARALYYQAREGRLTTLRHWLSQT